MGQGHAADHFIILFFFKKLFYAVYINHSVVVVGPLIEIAPNFVST